MLLLLWTVVFWTRICLGALATILLRLLRLLSAPLLPLTLAAILALIAFFGITTIFTITLFIFTVAAIFTIILPGSLRRFRPLVRQSALRLRFKFSLRHFAGMRRNRCAGWLLGASKPTHHPGNQTFRLCWQSNFRRWRFRRWHHGCRQNFVHSRHLRRSGRRNPRLGRNWLLLLDLFIARLVRCFRGLDTLYLIVWRVHIRIRQNNQRHAMTRF